jgi:transcriptional regulator with XRE-family HTH domain
MEAPSIGRRLRELRLERGISQADLARRLEISPAYLNLLEKGRRSLQFPLLLKALDALQVELEGFMASVGGTAPTCSPSCSTRWPDARPVETDSARLRAEPRVATTIAAVSVPFARAQLDTALSRLEPARATDGQR